MKKNSIVALAIVAALAVFSGCGKKPAPPKEYAPLAPEGTFVMAYSEECDTSQNPMAKFLLDQAKRYISDVRKYKAENPDAANVLQLAELPSEEEIEKGFYGGDCKWILATVATPSWDRSLIDSPDSKIEVPATAVVTFMREPTTVDAVIAKGVDELIKQLKSCPDESTCFLASITNYVSQGECEVSGCKVVKWSLKECEDCEMLSEIRKRVVGFEPCLGIYDGRLFIAASNAKVFADTVSLYANGTNAAGAESQVAKDIASARGAMFSRIGFYGIGDFAKPFFGDGIGDAATVDLVGSMKSAGFGVAYDNNEMKCSLVAGLKFANAEKAEVLKAQADQAKAVGGMFVGLTSAQPGMQFLLDIYSGITFAANGDTFAVEVPIKAETIEKIDFAEIIKMQVEAAGAKDAQCGDDEAECIYDAADEGEAEE